MFSPVNTRAVVVAAALLAPAWSLAPAAVPYDFGNPSPQAEWMRFVINRARTDPEAEADLAGLDNTHPHDVPDGAYDIGEGITNPAVADQRTYWSRYQGARQFVAWSAALNLAAAHHADDMYDFDFFDHYTQGSSHGYPVGAGPAQRGYAEGYVCHFVGENIACNNSGGSWTAAYVHQRSFFTEPEFPGRGHRKNLLHSFWREIGVGYLCGPANGIGWTDYWVVDFGSDAFASELPPDPWPPVDTVYVTGTVFDDLDEDGEYQPGEQMAGVTVRVYDSAGAELKYSAVTADGGGYSVPLLKAGGSDVAAGEQVEVLLADFVGMRYARLQRTVQSGDVVFEETAAEVPDAYAQRFNVGLNVEAGQLSPLLVGDANFDGFVDGADYTAWADHYDQAGGWEEGDFSLNGWVDGADYTAWADHYMPGSGGAAPEPSLAALLLLGSWALCRRRRGTPSAG